MPDTAHSTTPLLETAMLSVARFALGLTCCLLVGFLPACAAGEESTKTPRARASLVATGESLPRHLAVRGFFDFAMTAYKAGEPAFEYNVLRELDISPRTEAATRLEQAVLLGQALSLETLDAKAMVGEPEHVAERQRVFRLERAARLGDLYRALLADLAATNIPEERIERFIREQIAPNLFYHSTGSPEAAMNRSREIEQAFERGIEEKP